MFTPLLVQFNPLVGDLKGNRRRLQAMLREAEGYPLAIVPELALTGYPPRDLLEADGFVERCALELRELAQELGDCGPVIIGARAPAERPPGVFNAAWLLSSGEARVVATKQLLPAYDVFDEPRHFVAGEPMPMLDLLGLRIGVTICEDLWLGAEVGEQGRYGVSPAARLAANCDLLINLSASPYRRGRALERLEQAAALARRSVCTLAMVNAVGGNDELIFDGHSLVTDGHNHLGLPGFVECAKIPGTWSLKDDLFDQDRQALVMGLRDYVHKCGADRVVLGISGGIDSALVAALAVDALGATGKLIIGGKSMGGRVASMVGDELYASGKIAGLLCLGYPFHPPEKPDQLRTAHLADLKVPTLIVQGTRDPFGTMDEVSSYSLSKMIEILWLEDGDHDLKPRKSVSGYSAADHLKTLGEAAASWAQKITS